MPGSVYKENPPKIDGKMRLLTMVGGANSRATSSVQARKGFNVYGRRAS